MLDEGVGRRRAQVDDDVGVVVQPGPRGVRRRDGVRLGERRHGDHGEAPAPGTGGHLDADFSRAKQHLHFTEVLPVTAQS